MPKQRRLLHNFHNPNAAGIDEVGRGCIAGPVVAAAVIATPAQLADLALNDSKKLSAKQRSSLCLQLCQCVQSWGIGIASVAEIDRYNIRQASLLAMRRSLKSCWTPASHAWVDGRDDPGLGIPTRCVVGGDGRLKLIAAAAIIAKVYRDSIMQQYALEWPGYSLDVHKGYATKQHTSSLHSLGASPIHRRSFQPVCDLLN